MLHMLDQLKDKARSVAASLFSGGKAEELKADEPQMTLAEEAWDLLKTVGLAVVIVLLFRFVFFQPFNIPSSSMKPGMLIGDFIIVNKMSYGYSKASLIYPLTRMDVDGRLWGAEPERGDVVVFKNVRDGNKDYIKRVMGLPGDQIRVIGGVVHINGQRVEREFLDDDLSECRHSNPVAGAGRYRETLPNGVSYVILECHGARYRLDNKGPFQVPAGQYFMMGDNRDDSQDSRTDTVGFVAHDQLVGKAVRIAFSVDGSDTRLWEIWEWPWAVRYGRIFDAIQ